MIKRRDLKLRIAAILGLIVFSIFYIWPLKKNINLGLDLKGGMHVLLEADIASLPPSRVAKDAFSKSELKLLLGKFILSEDESDEKYVLWNVSDLNSLKEILSKIDNFDQKNTLGIWRKTASDKIDYALNAAVEKIRSRIDAYGVGEVTIETQGEKSILVQVPGVVDRTMIDRLKDVGDLEFRLVEDDEEKKAQGFSGNIPQGYELKEFEDKKLLLYQKPELVGSDLLESYMGFNQYGSAEPHLRFTSQGTKKFAKVTEENLGKQLAILLDGVVKSAPAIQQVITSGEARITGNFSLEEAKIIISVLNSGALPVPLSVAEERSVGPVLGSDSIKRGIDSIVLGAVLIVIFVLSYYFLGGIIAVICLALDLLFILVGLNMFDATLTLPGIAGMILTLGMAVDANVLIFERIREELKQDKPLSLAVKNGFNQAKRTIFDANITTLIAALFLFIYGSGPVKGFATTLSLGIVASIFTSVFVARTIFSLLLDLRLKKLSMLSLISSSNIRFVKARGVCIAISIIMILAAAFNFYSQGDKIYGVDFKGGQVLEYKITPPVEIEKLRSILSQEGFGELTIQEFKNIAGGVIIKSRQDIAFKLKEALKKHFGEIEELQVATVGPAIGKLLRKKAFLAIILSLLGIFVYVGVRFKHFDFALAAVIALFHDVVISLGALSFAGFEVNLLSITALLTIAGYSINDTIVIYDRIREISPRMPKTSLSEIINLAINNTLSRTLITSVTTLMVVISIFILGGEVLKGFSFTLLVGIIAGTYSSIYIAAPLVLLFRQTRV